MGMTKFFFSSLPVSSTGQATFPSFLRKQESSQKIACRAGALANWMTKAISYALALNLFIAMPAAAQTPPTVDISATNNNGDRDSTWDGLQVNEGDTVTISIAPSTAVTAGLVEYRSRVSGSLTPGDTYAPLIDTPANSFSTTLSNGDSFIFGGDSASGSTISLRIRNDSLAEADETLTITISNIQASFGNTQGFMLGTDSVTFTVRGTDTAPAFGSETVSDQTFNKYGPITEFQVPAATGGNGGPTTYTTTTLPTGLSFDADGSGDCPGDEAREICGTPTADAGNYTVTIIADDADCNPGANLDCSLASATTATADQARLSFTITIPRLPEISGNNTIDAADALLLFQHYSRLPVTEDEATRAEDWKDNGRAQGGDLNSDGPINHRDALIMYYAYEFGDLLNQSAVLRQLLLNGVRGRMPDTDATYRELLRRALRLR